MAGSKWLVGAISAKKCVEERRKREPGEDSSPERNWTGNRKRKNLQDARKCSEGPKARRNESHHPKV